MPIRGFRGSFGTGKSLSFSRGYQQTREMSHCTVHALTPPIVHLYQSVRSEGFECRQIRRTQGSPFCFPHSCS
ncbi:protein of unknown function [Burkholderia multivorans]